MESRFDMGFRIVGPCTGQRRLIQWAAALAGYADCDERARCDCEGYLSAFTFGADFAEHLRATGSTKGYAGPCGADYLWFDIDRTDDLESARHDAAKLVAHLAGHFGVDEDALLIFFSGSKGFHVGLPTIWKPPPHKGFHKAARHFCGAIAASVGIAIDEGVYDAVRAFRSPNSRHPKTGLFKRQLPVDMLMNWVMDRIVDLAKAPEPFELPASSTDGRAIALLADAWAQSTAAVQAQVEAIQQRRAAMVDGSAQTKLNRLTLDFIRDGAAPGDRHRLLYSAARNLAELGCPPALVHELLSESALDTGLAPSNVKRQIDCGLTDAVKGGING